MLALVVVLFASFTGFLSTNGTPLQYSSAIGALYALLWATALAALLGSYSLPLRNTAIRSDAEIADEGAYVKAREEEEAVLKGKQNRKSVGREQPHGTTSAFRPDRMAKLQALLIQRPILFVCLAAALFLITTGFLIYIFHSKLFANVGAGNVVFTYWRSINLFSGVSPLLPFLLITVGLYAWFWYTLSGLALFNCDRPQLPRIEDLDPRLPMFSAERAGRRIERVARPLCSSYAKLFLWLVGAVIVVFLVLTIAEKFSIRSFGPRIYGEVYFFWVALCIAVIAADVWQLFRTWTRLRELLTYLDRLPLRRTLVALKGFSWGTVWKMGGSVIPHRYRLLSREMESLRHLKNELLAWQQEQELQDFQEADLKPVLPEGFQKRLATWQASSAAFVTWFTAHYDDRSVIDVSPMERHQAEIAKTAAVVMNQIILPAWMEERHSLILDWSPVTAVHGSQNEELKDSLPPHLLAAEEFFALPYLGFIQNILGRIRTMSLGMLWLFVAATISVASYPFDPRPILSGIFFFVFVIVGVIVVFVYAEMHRDATLSAITNTKPGELGMDFWLKLVGIGAGPALALITALFPGLSTSVMSWLQPSVEAIK